MGSVIGTAASGLGSVVGNVVSSPFNGVSCERVCSGTWDLLCFIEHLCVTSVLKFFLAAILVLIVLYAGYLLCKLGVAKCLAKNACRLVSMPCWGGCRLLRHLWRKVRDTDRVYRGRRARRQPDVELGDLSTGSYDDYRGSAASPSSSDYSAHRGGAAAGRSKKWDSSSSSSMRGRRREDRIHQSLRPRRTNSKVEHGMRISRESERRHPHSVGAWRKEASSSLHGHGSTARHHSHAHRRT